jgi:NAD(P)-dependent dehydrogenase (short-subunit alcohol dehydrogenase family)
MEATMEGKSVIIAGAAGGLGGVATAAFAAAGARLTLLGRDQAKLDELAADLHLSSAQALAVAADVSDEGQISKVSAQVLQTFKSIDVLLNFVGGWTGGKNVPETDRKDFENMIDQHLFSIYAMAKYFVPPMQVNKWGRVLAVSSPNASRPPGKNSPYAAGKSAMEAVMLSLAQELRGSGVTANLVLVRTIDVKHERQINPSEENKGWTSPEEISATLLHLCSEEAGVINGARIPLFGEPF